jgi:hypothetical protein
MKGLSILATFLLLFLAEYLAAHLRHTGTMPAKIGTPPGVGTMTHYNAGSRSSNALPRTYSL